MCAYTVHVAYIHYSHLPSCGTPRAGRPNGQRDALRKRGTLDIIIANGSAQPIYEQIVEQVKAAIANGTLTEGQPLPSIRALASELRISVITTKRAYAELEEAGFINTVQGKGSFVAGGNLELLREERLRQIEHLLAKAVSEARAGGVSTAELREMLDLLLDE